MPPRENKKQHMEAGALASSAAAIEALPPDVAETIVGHLAAQNKLSNPQTAARDIASLAQASKAFDRLAKSTLWRLLGEQYSPEGRTGAAAFTVPKQQRWEEVHLPGTALWFLDRVPDASAFAQEYKQRGVPKEVPPHIFSECRRLSCMGISVSNAHSLYFLSDADLRGLQLHIKDRGSWGKARLHRLAPVLNIALLKHGSAAGLAARAQEKARKGQQRKRSAQKAQDARSDKLAAALASVGLTLSTLMLKISAVDAYLRGSKSAPKLAPLVATLQLADWCEKHTTYTSIRQAVLNSRRRRHDIKMEMMEEYRGRRNFWDALDDAADTLTDYEEEDCMRLACQRWAQRQGGQQAALGCPEVPPEGGLREALERALSEKYSPVVASYADHGLND